MSDVMQPNGCYCAVAVLYLASSSRGVSAHFVVRVVVTALESAPPDTAESSDSSRIHRSHILKPTPGKTEVGETAQPCSYIAQKASQVTHRHLKYRCDCTQSALRELSQSIFFFCKWSVWSHLIHHSQTHLAASNISDIILCVILPIFAILWYQKITLLRLWYWFQPYFNQTGQTCQTL